MAPSRLAVATMVAALSFAACGSAQQQSRAEVRAPVRTTARPIPVRADGILDPDRIDLGGVAGVTRAEQRFAEQLLRRTILVLPRWSDVAQAKADGFASIGDGAAGKEHWVRWDWIDDNVILDPNHPESLMYRVEKNGDRVLEAAMFMLPLRYRLYSLPDFGGRLMQFHAHNNLCFTDTAHPRYARLAYLSGGIETCPGSLVMLFTNAMVHVWIRPTRCGPFAAIAFLPVATQGNERPRCDDQHGSHSHGEETADGVAVVDHQHEGG
jgi:hypothetical protein